MVFPDGHVESMSQWGDELSRTQHITNESMKAQVDKDAAHHDESKDMTSQQGHNELVIFFLFSIVLFKYQLFYLQRKRASSRTRTSGMNAEWWQWTMPNTCQRLVFGWDLYGGRVWDGYAFNLVLAGLVKGLCQYSVGALQDARYFILFSIDFLNVLFI